MKHISTRIFLGTMVAGVMVAGSSVVAQRVHKAPPSNRFAQALASAKRAGFPTHPNELQPPLPPPSQNAAPLYVRLTQLLKTKPLSAIDNVADAGVGCQMPSREKIAQIRRALKDRSDITALVHQAASRPRCVFKRDWAQGPDLVFPEYAKMRAAARWLSAENAVQLADGKPLDALHTQALGFKIAHQIAGDRILIASLVSIAIDAITMAGMERILYADGTDPRIAEAVERTIAREHYPVNGRRALHGEMVLGLIILSRLRKEGPKAFREIAAQTSGQYPSLPIPSNNNSPEARKSFAQFVDANGVVFIHSLLQVADAFNRPYPQAKSSLHAFDATLKRNRQNVNYLITTIIFPVYEQFLDQIQRSEARAGVMHAGAAALAWKARHGTFPARLNVVLHPVPTDPFDGKPLRYRRESSGFAVYSVGPSGTFNGGTPDKKPGNLETVFRYPLPAYYRGK